MSSRPDVSGRAETDLAHQYRWYLDNATLEVAERFLASFDASVSRLAATPAIGKLRRFRAPELAGIRSWPVDRPFEVHLIFYRIEGNLLSVDRVMHGSRDLPRRLLERPEPL